MQSLGGMALLTILPRKVLGGPGFTAPSDQLTKGIIGVGGIGRSGYHFNSSDACRLISVCDVDQGHLNKALALGEKKFGQKLAAYHDYRDLINDPISSISPLRLTGMASCVWMPHARARISGARNP